MDWASRYNGELFSQISIQYVMALIVQKYGGTSMGAPERIRNVAKRVARWKAQGHQLVVVVSAMSGVTDNVIKLAREIMQNGRL